MGAWIEINWVPGGFGTADVAPVWGRGLKFEPVRRRVPAAVVAPVWGRGLKWDTRKIRRGHGKSPPYGGVD